jgi:mono/diheme cytochrome c family protein
MNSFSPIVAVAGAAVLAAGVGAYSGAFNVAADAPHWSATSRVIAFLRDRSIAVRADGQTVPNLADRHLIATGAEHYAEMCTACHLAPGVTNSELRQGLYPPPPDLTAGTSLRPVEAFWVVKHGIKMSGMPAWGRTHDDQTIWAIVAFLQQLPTLDSKEYAALTRAPDTVDHDHDAHGHAHEHDAGQQ